MISTILLYAVIAVVVIGAGFVLIRIATKAGMPFLELLLYGLTFGMVIFGFFIMWSGSILWGLFCLAIALIMIGFGFKEIPADPPQKGVLTIWGVRTSQWINEGYHLLADYFPFFIGVITIPVKSVNQDFEVKFFTKFQEGEAEQGAAPASAGTPPTAYKTGIEVTLPGAVTWVPDPERLVEYLNNGREEGVRSIVDDVVPQVLRIQGAGMTFEQLTASKEELIDRAIDALVQEDYLSMTPDQKSEFKREMLKDGKNDIAGLGIKIKKVNLGEPRPDEQAKQRMEALSNEQFDRRSEDFEWDTEIKQAQKLAESSNGAYTFQTALQEVRRRKAIREGHGQTIDVSGDSSGLGGFAATLGASFGQALGDALRGSGQATSGNPSPTSSPSGNQPGNQPQRPNRPRGPRGPANRRRS